MNARPVRLSGDKHIEHIEHIEHIGHIEHIDRTRCVNPWRS